MSAKIHSLLPTGLSVFVSLALCVCSAVECVYIVDGEACQHKVLTPETRLVSDLRSETLAVLWQSHNVHRCLMRDSD
eukprot:6805577-Pyramimonas_sp.AAC.1